MNALSFVILLKKLYGRQKPDLDWIQNQGLLAVKIAQHYALRVDFLDEGVCRHLARLYRQTTPVNPQDIRALLRERVDESWFDTVREFQDTPVAAASVGQVHRAVHKDGAPLAVKIIKRDFRDMFLGDLRRVRALMRVLLFFQPKLKKVFDPMGVLAHIEDYTIKELDLLNEMNGQKTLRDIAAQYRNRYDLSRLSFPTLYEDLSGPNVMVSEFVDGETFDERLDNGRLDYDVLLDLFKIHGFYLFAPGTFHGDIHPGNIILRPDGHICFLDTGAISTVSDKIRQGLYRFFVALSEYDYPTCARHINDMAEKPVGQDRLARFDRKFHELYADFKGQSVSQISLTRKMMQTIKLGVNSGMTFDQGMFPIIKSLMYLDGMVLRCNPDAVLIQDMRPAIEGFEKLLAQS